MHAEWYSKVNRAVCAAGRPYRLCYNRIIRETPAVGQGELMNHGEINAALLSELLENKRGQACLSLREAGEEIGISAPTLQRIEAGQVPTTSTLLKLAQWLGVSVDEFRRTPQKKQKRDTIEQIEVLLRADKELDPEVAQTIANVARQVYNGFKRQKTKRER
jgi:transcriptional regulator with XRE-family HTH domain